MTKSIISPRFRGAMTGLLALGLSAGLATSQDFSGKKISSVQVRYSGAKTVDEARIRNLMSVKAGQTFSADKLDDDIRSLVESGLVDDVRMSGESRNGGMGLIVEVVTRPALAGVGFAGNTNFSDKKLLKQVELTPGSSLSDIAIFEARQAIEEFYRDFGYPDVVVSHRLQATDRKGYSDLVLTVDEGERTEVYNIEFEGNNAFPDRVLKSEMETKEKGIFSFLTKSGRIDTSKLENDEELVLDFYRSKGYLRASSAGFNRVVDAKGKSSLVMKINEGIKYSVSKVSFAGKMSVFTPAELAPVLTLNGGDSFSSKKMRKDIRTIRSYYGSRGYADAAVDPDIRNAGQGLVKVVYRITEGKKYKVGRITIEGNDKTRDKVIRREIPLKPGDNFNTVDVETTRKRLQGLNYFSNVIAEGAPSGQKGYRDINVLVDEKNTGQLSFGLGLSSIDNIVGYINIEETNFDIANPSGGFRGGGQRFGLKLRAGAETQDFTLSLTEPWFMGQRLSLGGELFYKGTQNFSDQYEQRNVGAAVTLRKPLGKRSFIRGGLRFEKINVDIESDVPATSKFQEFDGDFTRPALSLNYVYDGRDAVSRTRKGHKVDLGVTAVLDALGGDSDSFIFSASGAKYWNLWADSVLEVSGSFTSVESSGDTPIYDRQFLGGARNLRGFEYRDVGPRDTDTGDVFGGNTSAFATVEWSFPLVSTVRGAVFYDAGIVNEDSFDFSVSDYYSDAGLGIRMNLPFGPIALDYAFPLETPDEEADKGAQFNFYVDYEF